MATQKIDPHEREALQQRVAVLEKWLSDLPRQPLTVTQRTRIALEVRQELSAVLAKLREE